jgi:hypothetical protein
VDPRPAYRGRRGVSLGQLGAPRCHHPLRMGDRLYVSYWHHGFFILDISDMSKPKAISHVNTSPGPIPHPTHTCLPHPAEAAGRDILVVADEDVAKLWPAAPAFHLGLRHHRRTDAGVDLDLSGAGP